jgi:hypothetical protein
MKNNFTTETTELFFWNRTCFWCGKQHANCYHHILGRCSNSPLNCSPLNNFECHIGNGKLSLFEYQQELLKKTYQYLKKEGYVLTQKDKEFIKTHKKHYDFI